MTTEENIRAILECNFSECKDEIIDIAVKSICKLTQMNEINIDDLKDKTLYGYNLEYLIVFAESCRIAGITPEQMKDYYNNFSFTFDLAQSIFDKSIQDYMEKLTKGLL